MSAHPTLNSAPGPLTHLMDLWSTLPEQSRAVFLDWLEQQRLIVVMPAEEAE